MKKLIVFYCLLMLSSNVFSTEQDGDILIYKGKTQELFTYPLNAYLKLHPLSNIFRFSCTGNYRGYVATWEIKENELYLVKLVEGHCFGNPPEIPITKIFPDQQAPIKATWFSGVLKVPFGKQLQYIHMGYDSVYEKELIITVENGAIISQKLINNSNEQLATEHEITLEELRKLKEWGEQHSAD